jgi:hypothetical protein
MSNFIAYFDDEKIAEGFTKEDAFARALEYLKEEVDISSVDGDDVTVYERVETRTLETTIGYAE